MCIRCVVCRVWGGAQLYSDLPWGVGGVKPLTLRLSVNSGSFLSPSTGCGRCFLFSTYVLAFWDQLGQPPAPPAPPPPAEPQVRPYLVG